MQLTVPGKPCTFVSVLFYRQFNTESLLEENNYHRATNSIHLPSRTKVLNYPKQFPSLEPAGLVLKFRDGSNVVAWQLIITLGKLRQGDRVQEHLELHNETMSPRTTKSKSHMDASLPR